MTKRKTIEKRRKLRGQNFTKLGKSEYELKQEKLLDNKGGENE